MTLSDLYRYTKQTLKDGGVDSYSRDACCLFEHIFSMDRTALNIHSNEEAEPVKVKKLMECIDRRKRFEPIQYIIGEWEFMGLNYKVGEGVLIPRDDTEVLTCACISLLKGKNRTDFTIADLCSGSGIIAVTLKKHFIESDVFAVEKSVDAYRYLCKNCEINKAEVKTLNADLCDCCDDFSDGYFDLIVSNPPYVITDEIATLQKEIAFEPKMALDGGADGFLFYEIIIEKWSRKLKPNGLIAFEIGENQFETVEKMLKNHGFFDVKGYFDLNNTVRAVTAVFGK